MGPWAESEPCQVLQERTRAQGWWQKGRSLPIARSFYFDFIDYILLSSCKSHALDQSKESSKKENTLWGERRKRSSIPWHFQHLPLQPNGEERLFPG